MDKPDPWTVNLRLTVDEAAKLLTAFEWAIENGTLQQRPQFVSLHQRLEAAMDEGREARMEDAFPIPK